ncbi:hypothetical protein EDC01DRAFT_641226 [Geopyxis carbonaria]|nr:hypothetical protein EDC01DRAFT_641226 [Geopyxis carbonaria]
MCSPICLCLGNACLLHLLGCLCLCLFLPVRFFRRRSSLRELTVREGLNVPLNEGKTGLFNLECVTGHLGNHNSGHRLERLDGSPSAKVVVHLVDGIHEKIVRGPEAKLRKR